MAERVPSPGGDAAAAAGHLSLPEGALSAALPASEVRARPVAHLVAFFSLTFLLAWAFWAGAAIVPGGDASGAGPRALLFLPGTFAPGIVALLLTARAEGREGLRDLVGRLFRWRVPARFYLLAVAYMGSAKLLAAVVHRAATGAWPAFGSVPVFLLLMGVVMSTPFQAGEELGWRGYALPRLASGLGLRWAGIVLGVIWALWHLPLFYLPVTDLTGQPFPVYLLSVTALSVAMAWLYVRTGGSLLLVMVMHAAVNNTTGIVPASVPGATDPLAIGAGTVGWITCALLWVGAGYFLLRMPRWRGVEP